MTEPAPETGASAEAQPAQPKRFLFLRRRTTSETSPAGEVVVTEEVVAEAVEAPPDPAERVRPGVLRRRRRQLDDAYQQALFDLGGLAMELHSRGLLAEDVMRRKAAEVADMRQQLDELGTRLDEIRQERRDRRASGRRPGVTCPACGARSPAGANFCASCGVPLAPAAAGGTEGDGGDQVTTVIEQAVVAEPDAQPTAAIPPAGRDDA